MSLAPKNWMSARPAEAIISRQQRKRKPARIEGSGPVLFCESATDQASFLVAAAMLSNAAVRVLREVATFMRIWFKPPRP